jgi:hypothetical protein
VNRARDHRSGPAYEEWVAERAKEVAEEQRLQKEAEAQTPEATYKRAADAEAQTVLELLRTGYVPDSLLPGAERMNGRVISNQQAAINNWKYFADTCQTFQIWMGRQLLDASERSDLAPIAPNYLALHNLMLSYEAYVEPAQPVAQPEVVAEPVLTPSERAQKKYHDDRTIVVVTDSATGQQFTEFDLLRLSASEERRLRRIAEKGTEFGSAFEGYLDVKDTQFARDQEIARRAAEEGQR